MKKFLALATPLVAKLLNTHFLVFAFHKTSICLYSLLKRAATAVSKFTSAVMAIADVFGATLDKDKSACV